MSNAKKAMDDALAKIRDHFSPEKVAARKKESEEAREKDPGYQAWKAKEPIRQKMKKIAADASADYKEKLAAHREKERKAVAEYDSKHYPKKKKGD